MHVLTKERWIALDGSILTEKKHHFKGSNTGVLLHTRKAIAYNVGPELATYIVNLHNNKLNNATEPI